jgi:UDP-N-acetylglucosamine 2-epimerase (non-hydrolysing)
MHRPSNVDDPSTLIEMVQAIRHIARRVPIVFPVHPRTRARLKSLGEWDELAKSPGVRLTEPLGYLEFLSLSSQAKIIVTDSGGLQEESTVLGIPCLTLRENTERPITVTEGTSTLVGRDVDLLQHLFDDILAGRYKSGRAPDLWDGHAAERIAKEVVDFVDSVPVLAR